MGNKAGGEIIDGRYEVIAECGRGGFSVVYKVFDRNLGRVLALKELHLDQSTGAGFVWQFKQEFMLTSRLRHPHTVKVYDFGIKDERTYYFTMDFVEGQPLLDWISNRETDDIVSLLLQISIALSYIHGRRVMHGDIKASNIIVRPKPPAEPNLPLAGSNLYDAGFATLMDFGLSSALAAPSLQAGGTVEYMAPERFLGAGADVRSDLYSFGVLAYQMLSRHLPFESNSIEGYAEHHLHSIPKPLASVVPGLKPAISDMVEGLLAKRPAKRPNSAAVVSEILVNALGARVPKTFAISPDVRPNQLFGRDHILKESLRHVLSWFSSEAYSNFFSEKQPYSKLEHQDRCLLILAEGASGSGRTEFLKALKPELQLCGLNVMTSPPGGQKLDIEGFVSATLKSAGMALEDSAQDSASIRHDTASSDISEDPAPNEVAEWARLSQRRLLAKFADRVSAAWDERSIVWLLDDFDLMEKTSQQALQMLIRTAAAAKTGRRIAIVLTGGPAADEDLSQLSEHLVLERLELNPLDESQIASLIDAAFRPNSFSREVASELKERTGGIPLFLSQCIESFLKEGLVNFADGRWELRADRFVSFSIPSSQNQVFESRLSLLSPEAMSVLLKAGVLSEPFAPMLMAHLGGMSALSTHQALDELLRHGLLIDARMGGDSVMYSLANPIIGDIVVARLFEEERISLHRLISQRCDSLSEEASKFYQGGNAVVEIPPCEPGQLRAISAIHAAHARLPGILERHYEAACAFLLGRFRHRDVKLISERILDCIDRESEPGKRKSILLRLGYLNFILGDHDEAIAAFGEGLSLKEETDVSLREEVLASCRLGVIYCGRGEADEARELYRNLIDRVKTIRKGKKGGEAATFSACLARLHTFLGQTYFAQCDYDKAGAELKSAMDLVPEKLLASLATSEKKATEGISVDYDYLPRLFRNLAIIDSSAGCYDEALELIEKAIRVGRRLHDASEHARSLMIKGTVDQLMDESASAENSYREALDYFIKEGFKEGILIAYNNLASILDLGGRPKEVALLCTKALEIAESQGNRYSRARILCNLGSALFEQGWIDEARRRIEEALTLCEEEGFIDAAVRCLYFKVDVLLAQRDISAASEALLLAGKHLENAEDQYSAPIIALARAKVCNASQDFSEASKVVSKILQKSEQLGKTDIALAHRLRAEAARGLGELDPARRDIADSLSSARGAGAIKEEALSLLSASCIEGDAGELSMAIELANNSLAIFKQMEAFLNTGITSEHLANLHLRLDNRSEALLNLELARDQFVGLDMNDEAARIDDRIETLRWGSKDEVERGSLAVKALYKVTRLFESLLDLDELLNRVMDAVIEILRAERGLIMLKDPVTGVLQTRVAREVDKQTIEDVSRISKSVIQRVVDVGKPLVTTDAQSDPRFQESKSVSLYDIRSIVCVPIVIAGKVNGIVYVDSSLSATVFTKQDLYLLSAFAAQASMAIEKAMLLEELQMKKDSLQEENLDLRQAIAPQLTFDNIVGDSGLMQEVFSKIRQVADTDVAVLIEGESGTGKELVARAIHHNGERKNEPFVKINCAAIPENLMENELFGHEKGAFTGANERLRGKFEVADGGTLFLDEIGDLPYGLQAKLLTAIENKEFQRVGGTQTVRVNARILTATNRNLLKLVAKQQFRKDLYYRINEVPIMLPPLRQRKGDIPHLVDHFIRKYGSDLKEPVTAIEQEALAILMDYNWPGNVRELESAIKRTLMGASKGILTRDCFTFIPVSRTPSAAAQTDSISQMVDNLIDGGLSPKEVLSVIEQEVLKRAIESEGWSIRKTAQELGISRNTLKSKLIAFGIAIPGS
ncbi:MAG: sigma 54-interacting transcriptional regulator [Candidatus Coatesbacteria bacterium]|nr:sigma 54-interacting transcriptional regulator [Candidatus Coatesbacteria bacterium]